MCEGKLLIRRIEEHVFVPGTSGNRVLMLPYKEKEFLVTVFSIFKSRRYD
jgi:hypothetical protein